MVVEGMSGEAGSFLTTILGAGGPRDLLEEGRLDMVLCGCVSCRGGDSEVEVGEEEEGWRRCVEGEREERLNDVRKR